MYIRSLENNILHLQDIVFFEVVDVDLHDWCVWGCDVIDVISSLGKHVLYTRIIGFYLLLRTNVVLHCVCLWALLVL